MSQSITLATDINIPEKDENLGEQSSLNVDAITGLLRLYNEEVVSYLNHESCYKATHIFLEGVNVISWILRSI
jgi:hypothetical protein